MLMFYEKYSRNMSNMVNSIGNLLVIKGLKIAEVMGLNRKNESLFREPKYILLKIIYNDFPSKRHE